MPGAAAQRKADALCRCAPCRAASILGIAAVGATLVVDGVLWFLAPISSEYLAISYAAAFVLSIIIQAITGRGQVGSCRSDRGRACAPVNASPRAAVSRCVWWWFQRHLSAKAQREQKEEALTNLAAGSASGGMVGGGEYRRLSDAEAGVHPAADTRKNSEPAFAAGERFRGDEFDMGPAYQGPTSINSGSVAVLPGQRAMGSGGRAASAGSRQENKFVVTFRQGTLGMGLTVPHNPLGTPLSCSCLPWPPMRLGAALANLAGACMLRTDSPSCAVVKRVSRGGQAEAQGGSAVNKGAPLPACRPAHGFPIALLPRCCTLQVCEWATSSCAWLATTRQRPCRTIAS